MLLRLLLRAVLAKQHGAGGARAKQVLIARGGAAAAGVIAAAMGARLGAQRPAGRERAAEWLWRVVWR